MSLSLEGKGNAHQPRAITASFFPPTHIPPSSAKKQTHQLLGDYCSISATFMPQAVGPLGMLAGLGWSHSMEGIRGDLSTPEESPPCPPVCLFLTYRQTQSAGAAPNRPWCAQRKGQRRQFRHRFVSRPQSHAVLLADYLYLYFPL